MNFINRRNMIVGSGLSLIFLPLLNVKEENSIIKKITKDINIKFFKNLEYCENLNTSNFATIDFCKRHLNNKCILERAALVGLSNIELKNAKKYKIEVEIQDKVVIKYFYI